MAPIPIPALAQFHGGFVLLIECCVAKPSTLYSPKGMQVINLSSLVIEDMEFSNGNPCPQPSSTCK